MFIFVRLIKTEEVHISSSHSNCPYFQYMTNVSSFMNQILQDVALQESQTSPVGRKHPHCYVRDVLGNIFFEISQFSTHRHIPRVCGKLRNLKKNISSGRGKPAGNFLFFSENGVLKFNNFLKNPK